MRRIDKYEVQNSLKALCGQEQVELWTGINLTLQVWGHLMVFINKTSKF